MYGLAEGVQAVVFGARQWFHVPNPVKWSQSLTAREVVTKFVPTRSIIEPSLMRSVTFMVENRV